MFTFNTTHIFTNYLKQLLSSFNLPKYRVYTKADQKYFNEHKTESSKIIPTIPILNTEVLGRQLCTPYIKNGELQEYVYNQADKSTTWLPARRVKQSDGSYSRLRQVYYYNALNINDIRNLKITSNIYDSYTHEYLGDYLRFHRDYFNIDLMPLYNCFSNRICTNLKLEVAGQLFDSNDSNYKIYMLPIKINQIYTIALDSNLPVELFCGYYTNYYNEIETFETLPAETYLKLRSISFDKPIIYDKLANIDNLPLLQNGKTINLPKKIQFAQQESMLKLFIKIPISCTSSITILEGDYTGYNEAIYSQGNTKRNHWITNFENSQAIDLFKPITTLQLLKINTGISYPFADKLVGYLISNTITDIDNIDDNIVRVQTVLAENGINYTNLGLWETKYRPIFYDYINDLYNQAEINLDILGYVDKDVEKYYAGKNYTKTTPTGKYTVKNTLTNVDIYPDMYNTGGNK